MRQLGGRLPEPPPVRMDDETPPAAEPRPQQQEALEPHEAQQPDPYPVEVHRIERQPVESSPAEVTPPPPPAEPLREPPAVQSVSSLPVTGTSSAAPAAGAPPAEAATAEDSAGTPPPMQPAAAPSAAHAANTPRPSPEVRSERQEPPPLRITEAEVPEPAAAGGRWAEFGEFRRLEPGRGSRISLEPMPASSMQLPPMASRGLLASDLEPERRSSFLTIAVPGIAAILAIGALMWSGSLRDRVHQQDVEMSALQEQNRKLADTLAKMHQDATASGVLTPQPVSTSAPVETTAPNAAANATPPKTEDNTQPAQADNSSPAPAPQPPAQITMAKREGISSPPPVRASQEKRGSHRGDLVDPNYHPEIVPPYPTLSKPQNVPAGSVSSKPAALPHQTYRPPFTVTSSGSSTPPPSSTISAHAAIPPRMPQSSGTPQSVRVNPPSQNSSAQSYSPQNSTSTYSATSSGMYASALAQNIEAVESLQRQSTVPLREFHAREGAATKVAPGVMVSVQSPDQARGTYALVVNGGGTSYQLRGYVNNPLAFTDNATHRVYELVVLRIAGGEAYGYIRPAQQ